MASITVNLAPYIVSGTATVYPRSNWSPVVAPSGTPVGSSTTSGSVASDGSVTFTGLTEGSEYVAYQASPDRYVRFRVPASTPGPQPTTGLLAGRPAATARPDRDLYVATDVSGGTLYQVQSGAWAQIAAGVLDTGGRLLAGPAKVVANQTGITTTVDITGATITFTAGSRPIVIKGWVGAAQNSVTGDGVAIYLTDSANTQVQRADVTNLLTASNSPPLVLEWILESPVAGQSYTYKLRASQVVGGSVSIIAGAARPTWIAAFEA